jgi:hypothetical protein
MLLLWCGTAMAGEFSKSGSVGAQFLEIGVGARYNGMGEATAATVRDVYSMYWNPAGLTGISSSELAFTTIDYPADINLNYVAYAKRFEGLGVLGASVTVLSMSDQEITTVEQPNGTGLKYSVSSYALQFSYARELTARLSFGASLKYIGERIYHEKSDGIAFDVGTLIYPGFRSLRVGLNISNMGPELKFDGPDLDVSYDPDQGNPNQDPFNSRLLAESYDLPLLFRIGMAYDLELGKDSRMTISTEMKHPNDNVQQEAFGLEYGWKEQYFLRAGYRFNYDEEGLGLGGGFRTTISGNTDLVVDYAWADYGRLESVHRFSIGISFW